MVHELSLIASPGHAERDTVNGKVEKDLLQLRAGLRDTGMPRDLVHWRIPPEPEPDIQKRYRWNAECLDKTGHSRNRLRERWRNAFPYETDKRALNRKRSTLIRNGISAKE